MEREQIWSLGAGNKGVFCLLVCLFFNCLMDVAFQLVKSMGMAPCLNAWSLVEETVQAD